MTGGIDKLINQHKNITEVPHLKLNDKCILYLIPKNDHNEKSTYSNIFKTLENTKQFCTETKITTLALPKICTDSDKKQWNIIANMIQFIFQNSITKIRIYSLPRRENDQKETAIVEPSAHALRVCLQNHNINKTTEKSLDTRYFRRNNSPLIFKNITINTIFLDLDIIKGNIDNCLNEYPNTLQLSNQNFVENKNKNNDDTITNMECRRRFTCNSKNTTIL
ncbi:Uncharacterized protein FWK35_00035674 [Aphis craccivora]|uniref:O-acetyl-ADP-ribose deacetylase 1-like n=1 Tax=Aphis craccivora TaxID=307492 RepID=A0A6G0VTU7_APHCR|nr:Uncharacterized protein FWK35_00035674 [Aphis craccivora]